MGSYSMCGRERNIRVMRLGMQEGPPAFPFIHGSTNGRNLNGKAWTLVHPQNMDCQQIEAVHLPVDPESESKASLRDKSGHEERPGELPREGSKASALHTRPGRMGTS